MYEGETSHEGKTRHNIFNVEEISYKALDLAKKSANGKSISYKGNIILSPRALRELLAYTLVPAFSAENVQRDRSILKNKIGEQIFNDCITIVDDGTLDYGLYSSKCDDEGTKTQRTVLVENGILKNYLSAENVQRDRSILKNKIGEQIFNDCITIVDDGTLDYGLYSSKCDDEGTKTQRTVLVENGILKNYLYDIKRANKEGKTSTGNASRGYSSLPYISPTNFIIEKTNNSLDDFDEYIYINGIIGSHTSNPITGDFAVEIQNSYYYKNGEIIPLKKGMFGGNIFEMFKKAIPLNDVEQRGKLISPSIVFKGEIVS